MSEDFWWMLLGAVVLATLVLGVSMFVGMLRAHANVHRFQERLVCLTLYFFGDPQDASMPYQILVAVLPYHEDQTIEIVAYLREIDFISLHGDGERKRLRLRPNAYTLFEPDGWFDCLPPEMRDVFEGELNQIRDKLVHDFGVELA